MIGCLTGVFVSMFLSSIINTQSNRVPPSALHYTESRTDANEPSITEKAVQSVVDETNRRMTLGYGLGVAIGRWLGTRNDEEAVEHSFVQKWLARVNEDNTEEPLRQNFDSDEQKENNPPIFSVAVTLGGACCLCTCMVSAYKYTKYYLERHDSLRIHQPRDEENPPSEMTTLV